jgi:hypothetical protein
MPPSHAWTRPRRLRIAALALVLLAPLVALTAQAPARGSTLPTGFTDSVVLGGLSNPTVVQFAADVASSSARRTASSRSSKA